MNGKSMSYYYMHDDTGGIAKITVGLLNDEDVWTFYSNQVDLPANTSKEMLAGAAESFFTAFIATHAQKFWKGKLDSNTDLMGQPVNSV